MSNHQAALPPITPSFQWIEYFQANARQLRVIPWDCGAGVTPTELAAITSSLQGWQLGETSDGSHLLAASIDYASRFNDPDFIEAARLFIAEEQRHGSNLGQFLDLAGVGRVSADWGDRLFRALRYSMPRMEMWATPVVMVETHAMVYYNAIRQATGSQVLRRVCEQILADEVAHIRFQCERLAVLHQQREAWLRTLTLAGHRVLFAAVTLAIWVGHRRALRSGGYSFPRFWRSAWAKMRHAWRLMAPGAYGWAEAASVGEAGNDCTRADGLGRQLPALASRVVSG